MHIDSSIPIVVAVEDKYLSFGLPFCGVKLRIFLFFRKKVWQNTISCSFGIGSITRTNELLQTKPCEVLREIKSEIAPFRIIARKKNCLPPKNIRVIVQICLHLLLDVGILGVELIVFGRFGIA